MQLNIKIILIGILLPILNVKAQSTILIGNTTVQVDTIFSGLDIPWEVKIGPDKDLWVTERSGLLSKINTTTKTRTVLLDLSMEIYQEAEAGLLGLALHPDFVNTPEVFIVYTYGAFPSISEKVVKYTYQNNALVNPVTILDGIYGNSTHIGSRIFFLPDTTMLISTGDVQSPSLSQDILSLNGKILRMSTDGGIPIDNPSPFSYVYSLGHRNVQGIAPSPSGKIFLSEHGASNDDEFQVLEADRNYGWPNVEGFCNLAGEQTFCTANNVKEPLLVWTPTIAPSDMVYYQNPAFPEFHNKMLMTVLKDKKLIAIEMNAEENAIVSETHYLTNQFDRLRDICVGDNKEIFIATSGSSWSNTDPFTHTIIRLTPPNDLSVKDLENEIISIHPNPSNGTVKITAKGVLSIEILDLNGKVIKDISNLKHNSNTNSIDFSELENGSYFLKFTMVNGESILKKHIKF